MSLTVPDNFYKPFYKVHIASLLAAEKVSEGLSVRAEGSEERLNCRMVWLQGEIVKLSLSEDWLDLVEGDSQIRIINISATPGGADWVQPGQYVQVLGQIDCSNFKVHCTKIISLLESKKISRANSKQLWDLEVAELHKVLTKRIKIRELENN